MAVRVLSTLIAAAMSTACAHSSIGSAGTVAYDLDEVDVRPRFRGCSVHDPIVPGARRVTIRVEYIVSSEGLPVDPRPETTGPGTARALEMAVSCTYDPALKSGRPVAVRGISRAFSVNVYRPAPLPCLPRGDDK